MNRIYLGIILAVVLIGIGGVAGYEIFAARSHSAEVNSHSVVMALQQEGFLVTETYSSVQQATISYDTGSVWKDFFWGQDITATANMKVSAGVDLTKITSNDVVVTADSIIVSVPPIQTHSVEVVGDITLVNKQGVLKRIFNNNDGYNSAYLALHDSALQAALTPDVIHAAQESTLKQVARIVGLLSVNKNIKVEFKNQ